MKFCTLASGSQGNATFIASDQTKVLIDAGINTTRIKNSLNEIGVSPEELDAVFVTHEHRDHVLALDVFMRRYNVPVLATEGTWRNLVQVLKLKGNINGKVIRDEEIIKIRDMEIVPFRIPHDGLEPVGYTLKAGNRRITVATDLGKMQENIYEKLKCSDLVLLESNYDEELLKTGPYPYFLKKRILSETGHLSNSSAAETILKLLLENKGISIILGHLSQTNNYPRLVLETIYKVLSDNGLNPVKEVKLDIADRFHPSRLYSLRNL